jgi:hypothetical protein
MVIMRRAKIQIGCWLHKGTPVAANNTNGVPRLPLTQEVVVVIPTATLENLALALIHVILF